MNKVHRTCIATAASTVLAAVLGTAMAQTSGTSAGTGGPNSDAGTPSTAAPGDTSGTGSTRSGSSSSESAQKGSGAYGHDTMSNTKNGKKAGCEGLSDRQTERACKDEARRGSNDANPAKKGNSGGNTGDQAN